MQTSSELSMLSRDIVISLLFRRGSLAGLNFGFRFLIKSWARDGLIIRLVNWPFSSPDMLIGACI